MTFVTAGLAMAGAVSIAVPILIHLLSRQRRRPIKWAAMRFLMEALRKHRRRLQLEQILLLAVRCLILALLGAALARPFLEAAGMLEGAGSRVVYLVIDNGLASGARTNENGDIGTVLGGSVDVAVSIVESLGPGEMMVVKPEGVTVRPYWRLPSLGEQEETGERDGLDRLHQLLQDATHSQLMSDVPLGTYNSGGVDSSLVTSFAADEIGDLNTFCIGLRDPKLDERRYAQLVAQKFATRHRELVVDNTDYGDHLADVIYRYGEERYSRRIARAICERRQTEPIRTAGQLADVVRRSLGAVAKKQRIDPATRTFQALRIAVNEELKSL